MSMESKNALCALKLIKAAALKKAAKCLLNNNKREQTKLSPKSLKSFKKFVQETRANSFDATNASSEYFILVTKRERLIVKSQLLVVLQYEQTKVASPRKALKSEHPFKVKKTNLLQAPLTRKNSDPDRFIPEKPRCCLEKVVFA